MCYSQLRGHDFNVDTHCPLVDATTTARHWAHLLTFLSIGPGLGTYFVRHCRDGTSSSENLEFLYDQHIGNK